jgi:type I restriction-modification system DNA methylase subunit
MNYKQLLGYNTMGRSTVHYADNDTNNILKRLHNRLRPAGTPVERVEYIIELLLLRIFEVKLRQDDIFKPLRKLFEGEKHRLLFSYLCGISNGNRVLSELNKNIFPFYAAILHKVRKVIKGNLPPKMQDQLVLMKEVFANSNFTNNVKGGVINEVIGLINEIDEKYILKTDLLGDAIESALSETGGTKDLGLYRTPDHIRQMMVAMVDPEFTDSIFDPACGTAGFLFDAYDYVINKSNSTNIYPSESVAKMFYRTGIGGIEYQGRIRKMAAVNMYIRGLNPHNIMQGDSLKMYDPAQDAGSKTVVIANPPFGAERDQPAYPNVWEEYSKESETTILFVKLMFDYLKAGGRCAVIVSEGFLTWGQGSACTLRKMLLTEANLRAIISLPQGVFVSKGGQGAKTSILYFEKGQPTDFVWYYKIENDGFSMGTNRKPIESSQIPELLTLFKKVKHGKKPKDTSRSFFISRKQIETLDPKIEEQIKTETREKVTERNALKREKKIAELDKKLTEKKITKTVYKKQFSQFNDILETQVENEIAKAVEKAHTYHFNLQNYRTGNKDNQTYFPLVELKELITPKFDKIQKNDFQGEFDVIDKISFSDGKIHLRKNRETGMDLYKSERGDLITSKINVHQGAVTLSPAVLVCSTHYQIYSINKARINPLYLVLILRAAKFLKIINLEKVGGIKNEAGAKFLCKFQIPLPPLEIQNEIIEKIEKQKQIIEGAEKIEECWSINIPIASRFCPKAEIGTFILASMYGTSNKADYQESGHPVLRIGNIGFCNFDLSDLKKVKIKAKEYEKLKLKKGDFLIVRSNGNPNLVGKCAVWDGDDTYVYASYLIRFIFDTNKISPKYIMYHFMSPEGREQLLPKQGGGTYNISSEEFKKYIIPIPSLETQHKVVEEIDKQMAALESVRFLKAEAEKRIEEILASMWKEKPVVEAPEFKQDAIVPKENDVEEKAFFKRKVLATYIINQSLTDPNFGDVKFEKIFYLSEYFVLKRNFDQKYYVQAAGPYDNKFTMGYFKQVEQSKWFIRRKNGNQYTFSKGEEHDKSLNTYSYFSDKELEQVNLLINYFEKWTYEIPEIIATLYAVWNNRIIKQEPITDDLLKEDFLNWDEQKIKYKDRLDKALKWMRDNGIVPDGWGKVIEKANKKVRKTRK